MPLDCAAAGQGFQSRLSQAPTRKRAGHITSRKTHTRVPKGGAVLARGCAGRQLAPLLKSSCAQSMHPAGRSRSCGSPQTGRRAGAADGARGLHAAWTQWLACLQPIAGRHARALYNRGVWRRSVLHAAHTSLLLAALHPLCGRAELGSIERPQKG